MECVHRNLRTLDNFCLDCGKTVKEGEMSDRFYYKYTNEIDRLQAEVSRLQERVRTLEEGIRKHRDTNEWESVYGNRDAELYKLLEDK